jgi:hypothetical protein
MGNWKENIRFDGLNSDPKFIRNYKNIRKHLRTHIKLIRVLMIIFIISPLFILYLEPLIKDNIIFKTLLMVLNLITFISVFSPLSIQENITENKVENLIDKKKKDEERDKILENKRRGLR